MKRNHEMKRRSRRLRGDATPSERILWRGLRDRRLAGFKFRRQHVLGSFIVDLYCAEARLVVELDGESHVGRERNDAERQAQLEARGLKVLRFWDTEAYEHPEAVLEAILEECEARRFESPSP